MFSNIILCDSDGDSGASRIEKDKVSSSIAAQLCHSISMQKKKKKIAVIRPANYVP